MASSVLSDFIRSENMCTVLEEVLNEHHQAFIFLDEPIDSLLLKTIMTSRVPSHSVYPVYNNISEPFSHLDESDFRIVNHKNASTDLQFLRSTARIDPDGFVMSGVDEQAFEMLVNCFATGIGGLVFFQRDSFNNLLNIHFNGHSEFNNGLAYGLKEVVCVELSVADATWAVSEPYTIGFVDGVAAKAPLQAHNNSEVPSTEPSVTRDAATIKTANECLALQVKHLYRSYWEPIVVDGDTELVTSKYFGKPWLADSEPWPTILGSDANFILQLVVADLPKDLSLDLGESGLIQLFYCSEDVWPEDNNLSSLALVRLVNPGEVAGGSREPSHLLKKHDGFVDSTVRCIAQWDRHEGDLPRHDDADEHRFNDMFEQLAEEFNIYSDDLEATAVQGDKLGGWPFWVQGAERPIDSHGKPMKPFYQLDMGCYFDGPRLPSYAPGFFSSSGVGHIFISESAPRELTFLWACT